MIDILLFSNSKTVRELKNILKAYGQPDDRQIRTSNNCITEGKKTIYNTTQ